MQIDLHHGKAIGRREVPRHGPMLEATPFLRHDQELGADLSGDERHLPLAENWDQRVLHCADPCQCEKEHHSIKGGWQLPGHNRAGCDPPS